MFTELNINTRLIGSDAIKSVLDIANDIWNGTQTIAWDATLSDEELIQSYLEAYQEGLKWIRLAIQLDDEMGIRQQNVEAAYRSHVREEGYRPIKGILEYEEQNYLYYMVTEYNKLAESRGLELFESPWTEADVEEIEKSWYEQVDENCKKHLKERKGGTYIPIAIRKILNAKPVVTELKKLTDITEWSDIWTFCNYKYESVDCYIDDEGVVREIPCSYSISLDCSGDRNQYLEKDFHIGSENIFSIYSEDPETETKKLFCFEVTKMDVKRAVVGDVVVESGSITAKEIK